MYFKFFKRQYWDKRAAKDRRRKCAVLPYLLPRLFLCGMLLLSRLTVFFILSSAQIFISDFS